VRALSQVGVGVVRGAAQEVVQDVAWDVVEEVVPVPVVAVYARSVDIEFRTHRAARVTR
jgi:hypothetical protein